MTDHQHQCNGCGRLFKNKDELEAHKLTHNSDGSHRFQTRFFLIFNSQIPIPHLFFHRLWAIVYGS